MPHISIARYEIDEGSLGGDAAPAPAPPVVPAPRRKRAIPLAVAAGVAAGLVAAVMFSLRPFIPSPMVMRFALALDRSTVLTSPFLKSLALSPDGTRLVYVANRRLCVRSMSDFESRPIAGSDAAGFIGAPELSPDGSSVVFWSGGIGARENALKKISVGGGTAVTLAKVPNPFGMTWNSSGIIFCARGKEIFRLAEGGGELELLVSLKGDELASGPQMLPDGQTLLFTLTTERGGWDSAHVVVQSLKSGARKTIVPRGTAARYLPTGHLVYAVGGVLFAVAFDLKQLESAGGAVPVVEGVQRTSGNEQLAFDAQYSVSRTGSLIYLPGPANVEQSRRFDLAWTDRTGVVEALKLAPNAYENPRLSNDGKRVAFGVDDGRNADIWVYDVSGSSSPRRLTFGGRNRFPLWSPDGQRVAFQSDRDGDLGIFWQRANVSGTAERLTTADREASHIPDSWSPKGDILLFDVSKSSNVSLWTLSLADRKTAPFGDAQSSDPTGAVFSPDGRWIAYSGGARPSAHYIYVQPYPATGERNQISIEADDGHHPLWSSDGKELFFVGPGRFVGVNITTKPTFVVGTPVAIPRGFTEGNAASFVRSYDVSPDRERFIGVVVASDPARSETSAGPQLDVVLNWSQELKQKVPAGH